MGSCPFMSAGHGVTPRVVSHMPPMPNVTYHAPYFICIDPAYLSCYELSTVHSLVFTHCEFQRRDCGLSLIF